MAFETRSLQTFSSEDCTANSAIYSQRESRTSIFFWTEASTCLGRVSCCCGTNWRILVSFIALSAPKVSLKFGVSVGFS